MRKEYDFTEAKATPYRDSNATPDERSGPESVPNHGVVSGPPRESGELRDSIVTVVVGGVPVGTLAVPSTLRLAPLEE